MATGVVGALLIALADPTVADTVDDLQAVAVTIERTPAQSWAGYGIYLGDSLVITAAHVAGRGILTHPVVVVAGQRLSTETVKEGSYPDDDLAVLRITSPVPPQLAQHRATVCGGEAPNPGKDVLVATSEKVTSSTVISPEILPPDLRSKYAASIKDVYTTGNSGSGVFDAAEHCLLGIMSSKIEVQVRLIINGSPATRTVGLAKHFVPAADIRTFLDGVLRP